MTKSKPAQARLRGDELATHTAYRISRGDQTRGSERTSSTPDGWSELDKLDDQQIANAVAKDRDAAPVDDIWPNARVIMPVPKQPISIRLDEDVVAFFKKSGAGYQSRMNAVLRSYMEAKK